MLRPLLYLLLALALLGAACTKNNNNNESLLYGTWVKGPNTGDTLYFLRKDGKNIMRSNQSFNPSLTAWSDWEYRYSNGKLSVALFGGTEFRSLDSFTWLQQGKKFDVLGYQVFMFMSSSMTHFVYTKVN